MIFLILPLVIIAFSFIFYQLKYAALIKAGNRIPGPPNWPILGNAQYFINTPVEENLKILGEFVAKYGETYRVWIGNELNVFFQNREDLKIIMSGRNFVNKGSPYDLMRPWLNEGLLVSKGKKWFTRRKIITPAFHFTILEQYTRIFEKQSQIFCGVLKRLMKLGAFELYQPVNRYTMDVISGMSDLIVFSK